MHLGSCHTSTLQPWVGSGYLEPAGAQRWQPRTLASAKPQHWLTPPAAWRPEQPGLERLGILLAAATARREAVMRGDLVVWRVERLGGYVRWNAPVAGGLLVGGNLRVEGWTF